MPLPLFLGLAVAAAAGANLIKKQVDISKEQNAVLEEAEQQCKKEAQSFVPQKTLSKFQNKIFSLLREHAFTDDEKNADGPVQSDWGHLPKETEIIATRKHSLFGWGDYSFYTTQGVYYHSKKQGVHKCLYYDYINAYDALSETVDYGPEHEERDISQWNVRDQKFVEKVAHIWQMQDEKDTSILEFCFNENNDFRRELAYFKTDGIWKVFKKCCKDKGKTLSKYLHNIKISSMEDKKVELQFWYYFHQVENVVFSENDTEEDIREKEWEQERREQEAEDLEIDVGIAFGELQESADVIVEIFQQALYRLYGVLFEKENITFLEEPDFTYEGPSFIDRVEGAASSAKAFLSDYVERNYK